MREEITQASELAAARERIATLEERCRHDEARLRVLVDNMPDGVVCLFDRDLRFLSVGGRALQNVAVAREMVEGRTLRDVFPSETCDQLAVLAHGIFEGRDFKREVEFRGRTFFVQAVPVRDEAGNIGYGVAFVMDWTERKRTEAELRLHAERYRILTDNVEDTVWAIDADGRVSFASPSVTKILGFTAEEIEGRPLVNWISPETSRIFNDAQRARRELEARGVQDNETRTWCLELLRKDGSRVWTETLVTPIRNEGGVYLGLIGVTRNITARMEMQQALEQAKVAAVAASRAKSEFLASMSHEIRAPLNGIMGTLQLLQSTPLNAAQLEFVESALESSQGLLRVINDILDYARMEAGKMPISPVWFDFRQTMASLLEPFQKRVVGTGVTLTVDIADDVPTSIRADEPRLRQVLTNVIGNAVKFTPRGSIDVRVTWEEERTGFGTLRAVVRDTGVGIPGDVRDRLFDPFMLTDGSFTRPYQGFGLGLGIARRLVALMGGTVTLRSEEGQGTKVAMALPVGLCLDCGRSGELSPVVEADTVFGRGASILLVDDDRFSEKMLGALLRGRGFVVTGVSNGRQALDVLRSTPFDAVIMDIQMPELDGLTATRIIRTDPEFAHVARIPLIALTAHAMQGDRDRFLSAGMDAYVSKPVNMRELLEVVGKAVVGRRGRAAASA